MPDPSPAIASAPIVPTYTPEEIENVAKFLFRQLACALYHLHEEMSMIHRDIKPDNILFAS